MHTYMSFSFCKSGKVFFAKLTFVGLFTSVLYRMLY